MTIPRTLARLGIWLTVGCATLAAQRYTLSGTVVDGVSNRPMAGVAVTLATRQEPLGDPVLSDAEGRFAFAGLPAGEYFLSGAGSFGTVPYAETADPGSDRGIRVTADKIVVFRIQPRGSIEGTVRDEFGDPMMGSVVSVVRSVWSGGRVATQTAGARAADDRGRFRFGNLPPGSYAVCAAGGQNAAAPVEGPVDFTARVNRSYVRTCNRAFQLAPGQRAQVDLSPQAANTATVSGHVRNVPAHSGVGVYLQPEDSEQATNLGGGTDPNGVFAIHNVPAGRYLLRATAGGGQSAMIAQTAVDVGGSDVGGIELTLDPGAAVELAIDGVEENHLDASTILPVLDHADADHGTLGASRRDGSFHFEGIPPGRYRLTLSTPPEACMVSLKLGGREVRGAAFDIPSGGSLHLAATVSKACGTIAARAVRDGAPVPGAKLVLLESGTPADPGRIREEFADDEGEYSFTGLAPGHYLLWGWAVEGEGAIPGPASLQAVEAQAAAVDVTAGEPAPVDIPLLREGGNEP